MEEETTTSNTKQEISPSTDIDAVTDSEIILFDKLPDDLVTNIASKLGAAASCPADYFNLRLTCKRLNQLGLDPSVLSKLSPNVFPCNAKNWGLHPGPKRYNLMKTDLGRKARRFLKSLIRSGNLEASYTLGMIMSYIRKDARLGRLLIHKAVKGDHPPAMYAMFVIHYNGSAVPKNIPYALKSIIDAALSGHVVAIRELGYRVMDGFERWNGRAGWKDPEEGRRLLMQANAKEIVAGLPREMIETAEWGRISVPVPRTRRLANGPWLRWIPWGPHLPCPVSESELPIMSDFGWGAPPDPVPHPVHRFLAEWYEIQLRDLGYGLRLCSGATCGRSENRIEEFFLCPGCGGRCYCSRACQHMDWRSHHIECIPNHEHYRSRVEGAIIPGLRQLYEAFDEERNKDIALDEIKEEKIANKVI